MGQPPVPAIAVGERRKAVVAMRHRATYIGHVMTGGAGAASGHAPPTDPAQSRAVSSRRRSTGRMPAARSSREAKGGSSSM